MGLVVQLGWGIDREEKENKMEERESLLRRPHKEEMENGGEKGSDGGTEKINFRLNGVKGC